MDESKACAEHFEGVAQPIHVQACVQIVNLKTMVESLYESCQNKDQTIHGLSNDLGAPQNEVALAPSQFELQEPNPQPWRGSLVIKIL